MGEDSADKNPSLVKNFTKARNNARDITGYEKDSVNNPDEYGPAWGTYDKIETYDGAFAKVLHKPIAEILREKRGTLGHVFAMDAMGQGRFYALGAKTDGEVALTLADIRTDEQKRTDAAHHKEVIPGNILTGTLHSDVRDYLKKHAEEMNGGFDLITCRPLAGWDSLLATSAYSKTLPPNDIATVYLVTDTLFQWLSPKQGVMCIRMPFLTEYEDWVKTLNATDGLEAESVKSVVKIVKLNDSVKHLPRPPQIATASRF